jgi:hypothetical protein
MKAKSNDAIHSEEMGELVTLFNSLRKPYGQGEIVRFNLVYQRLYPHLTRSEKQCAEKLVDALLDNLADEGLAPKVYGVV